MRTKAPAPASNTSEFLKTNTTLLVWLLFLTLGGGLLALYYARVGYLPDIEWRFSLVYLAVVSFIGAAFGLLQSLTIFLPGYIWAETLICDSQLVGVFCYEERNEREPSVYRVFRYLGVPFGACLIISHIILPFGVWPYLLGTIVLLAAASAYIWLKFSRLIVTRNKDHALCHGKRRRKREYVNRICKYIFWFDLSVLLSQIAILLIYYISSQPRGLPYVKLSCLCIVVVLLSNHVVAACYWRSPRQAIIASLVASLLLIVAADRFTPLTERIMALYGFGGGHKVNLLVNDEGAGVVEKLGLPSATCGMAGRNNLCGAEILSDVGSEYLIRLDETTFTLPKSMVIARSARGH